MIFNETYMQGTRNFLQLFEKVFLLRVMLLIITSTGTGFFNNNYITGIQKMGTASLVEQWPIRNPFSLIYLERSRTSPKKLLFDYVQVATRSTTFTCSRRPVTRQSPRGNRTTAQVKILITHYPYLLYPRKNKEQISIISICRVI